jgi:hypothetical protein
VLPPLDCGDSPLFKTAGVHRIPDRLPVPHSLFLFFSFSLFLFRGFRRTDRRPPGVTQPRQPDLRFGGSDDGRLPPVGLRPGRSGDCGDLADPAAPRRSAASSRAIAMRKSTVPTRGWGAGAHSMGRCHRDARVDCAATVRGGSESARLFRDAADRNCALDRSVRPGRYARLHREAVRIGSFPAARCSFRDAASRRAFGARCRSSSSPARALRWRSAARSVCVAAAVRTRRWRGRAESGLARAD